MHELRRVFVAKGRLGDIITLPGQLRNGQRLTAMGKGGRGINKHRHQLASMPARTSGADGHTLSACLSVCLFPNNIYTWGSNLFPVGAGLVCRARRARRARRVLVFVTLARQVDSKDETKRGSSGRRDQYIDSECSPSAGAVRPRPEREVLGESGLELL